MLLTYAEGTNEAECRQAVLNILAVTVNSLTAHLFTEGGESTFLQTLVDTFCVDINLQV